MYKIFTAQKCGKMQRCIPKFVLIMKLTGIFMLLTLLQVSAASLAQHVSINVKNAPVKEVLNQLTKQTGYNFICDAEIISSAKPVTINANDTDLKTVLKVCFASETAEILAGDNNTIIVRKKILPPAKPVVVIAAISVSGKVTDSKGLSLPGVSVAIKGTQQGTTSDGNGDYTIKVPNTSAILVFTFIGMVTQEVAVNNRTIINVVLADEAHVLTDVVVVGYGTQSRATVTAAIAKVDGKSIASQPVSTPGEALAGLAAGVQVQSDQGSKPGAAPTIRVRGISSLSSSNDPLYVVDGYPLESASNFNLINPGDIESIEVLKDAASAAIYGSRAANGVVIVTTKRGKAGKTTFSVSAYNGVQSVNRFISVLKRDQYVQQVKDLSRIKGLLYPTALDGDVSALPDVDWQKAIFRNAPLRDFELNASGGSEKVRFNASAGLYKQQGVLIGTDYSRYTTRINLDADLVDKVKFGFSISPSYAEQFRQPSSGQASGAGANPSDFLVGVPGLVANVNLPSPLNQALTFQPIVPVYKANGDIQQPYDRDLGYNLSPTAAFSASNFYNPVGILSQSINRSRAFRTLSSTFLEYSPISDLKLKTYLGATLENEQVHAYIPGTMAYGSAPTASASNPSLIGIYASDNTRTSFDWVWENTATYDKQIGKHHFNLLGLFSAQKYNSQINYTAGLPGTFITTAVQSPLASPNTVGTELFDANTFVSYAGRVTYDYAKKYLFTAAVRDDGSSRFGPNNRYAIFPSFSAGWRVSEEPFMKPFLEKLKINELKLRGGYGRTGNANIGSFTYVNSIALNTNYASGSTRTFGTQQTGFANPDLTWEKNDQTSVGIDLSFLNSAIVFTADYFQRNSNGMLLKKALPLDVGYASSYQANLGKLSNNGLEFNVNTGFNLGKVRWNANANLSTYRTKVLDLGGPSALPAVAAMNGWNNVYQVQVGQPLGLMYGYVVTGVFKNAADLANNPKATSGNSIGDWMIKDINGDGKIDANDRTVLGHGLPDYTYGLTNTFQYKNFDLSVLIQGVQGVSIINGNNRQTISGNNNQNSRSVYYKNYFDPATPDRNVTYPSPLSGAFVNPGNALVNLDVENGSYLRVRNITLGYRMTDSQLHKIFIKTARIYVTAQNPFLITKYSGYNPEANIMGGDPTTPGVDQGTYPTARTIIVGVNFGF
ncbi:TonB-linked SusC/RagA family outer membrane protein [Mucilaginibacter gracilis]|uniref:TonB-linked SusC/RagA family outer membrane protein n=1 Tax=Mucilaginibacter gracilis TaxID=423350 RepID=A0A495IU90_9SPHI|nr:TonB-dependent receptor [Mucilaginibacter gracilis]RKR80317.1 TonB-linked SusC/RagA family outer membrane protein [Mucilaginibacter gracilis]